MILDDDFESKCEIIINQETYGQDGLFDFLFYSSEKEKSKQLDQPGDYQCCIESEHLCKPGAYQRGDHCCEVLGSLGKCNERRALVYRDIAHKLIEKNQI